ncbi:MAG: 50S ribosomal protein L5 [Candidatus Kapabacteria bacterium]|jgi:large subunit ribosomal protein L5|nr:50S ribosomal protein L5 [Candidatus Kapabacteria bacterium]
MAKQQNTVVTKKNSFVPEGKRLEDVSVSRPTPPARLLAFYNEKVIPALMEKYGYKSIMQVPKLEKICLNMGVGEAATDQKLLVNAINELELIAGQRPVIRKAKKAISNFKLREGMPIGASVTLRRARMYEFLDRFINIVSPRVRDFRGFPDKSFDGRGNYTLGIKEQIIFPEIDVDKVSRITGFDITFVMSAKTDGEAHALLNEFGFPFKKK